MLRTISCLCLLSSIALADPSPADPAPIIGGTTVPLGRWPDVVAVLGRDAECTGTLIAPDVVLTAGHCIETNPVEVIVGSVDLGAAGGDAIKVKWSRAYPDWEHRYDVGVVVLEHVARPKPRTIAAACTANDLLPASKTVEVVGFGLTTRTGTGDNTRLHQVALPIVDATCASDPSCERSVAPNGEFTAGGHGGDSCFGDSGGPAYLDTPDGPVLVGVVSRGLALPGAPCGNGGVYVRADKVVAWIQSVTGRKLSRTSCDRRADDPGAGEGDDGGCSTTGGSEIGGLVGIALFLVIRRRSRATQRPGVRPDDRGAPRALDPAGQTPVADGG
jgi:secreted trypsin-like serine protease